MRSAYVGMATALLAALIGFMFVPSAQADPVHPFLPEASLDGSDTPSGDFDKACGTAVDSEGDIYVSSAGNDTIEVFDPEKAHLATIANVNEPCGLAVDSKGNLYASEAATGNVVKYTPSAYPFVGTPVYGAPATIDSSGDAKGIAVDPSDDRLYVAKGTAIDLYTPAGALFKTDEVQHIGIHEAGGSFTLSFEGAVTNPISAEGSQEQFREAVEDELEALTAVDPGDVTVTTHFTEWDFFGVDVAFAGAFADSDVEQLVLDPSALTGDGRVLTLTSGFNGHIGQGVLVDATGVGVFTAAGSYKDPTLGGSEFALRGLYVYAADAAGDEILGLYARVTVTGTKRFVRPPALLRTIDGVDHDLDPETPDQQLGFGPAGAALAVDPGSCPPAGGQACTAGHFFVYDDEHAAVNEFEADGEFVSQTKSPAPPFAFEDAEPTAIAVDRSGGENDGTVYVTSGASGGARLLAFRALSAPTHPPLPDRSFSLANACGTAVDSHGNIYVSAKKEIRVYDPTSASFPAAPVAKIVEKKEEPCDLAVDSEGTLYARYSIGPEGPQEGYVVKYVPEPGYPPVEGTTYSAPVAVDTDGQARAITVNPADDHLFVSKAGVLHQVAEYDSAANGSVLLDGAIAREQLEEPMGVAVDGTTETLYVYEQAGENSGSLLGIDLADGEVTSTIDGAGSPNGTFSSALSLIENVAVDQATGHIYVADVGIRDAVEEYDASGTFVSAIEGFTDVKGSSDVALDQSSGAGHGNVYVPFHGELSAFGPLAYGEPPVALTGAVDQVGDGFASVAGTVDPRGDELTDCHFEYLSESQYLSDGESFVNAASEECIESPAEIGSGSEPVPVHAELTGLAPGERYYYRLVAANEIGQSSGEAAVFGPPLVSTGAVQPIFYTEATLQGTVDPSGLATEYRVEYGTGTAYGHSTASFELPSGAGPTAVEVPIFGLAEGTEYHLRLVAENEAGMAEGADRAFKTRKRTQAATCPNATLRTGAAADLPDCRAYELVTPADTNGFDPTTGERTAFNNWLVTPEGPNAGNDLIFFSHGSLPGTAGNGRFDGHRAVRGPEGWASSLFTPSAAEAEFVSGAGVSSDHNYATFRVGSLVDGPLEPGAYLHTPKGIELIGSGSAGSDPGAEAKLITDGGEHVLFSSAGHLEEAAAPAGTRAIYDRSPGGPTHVVSTKPDGSSFGPGEHAAYLGAAEDGSTVAFTVAGSLYVRVDNSETVKVADGPNAFAGFSEDGSRLFYSDAAVGETPGTLFAFDLGSLSSTELATNSIFVNISQDGSHVYLTSKEVLDEEAEGTAGLDNLYLWSAEGIDYVTTLDSKDLIGFNGKDIVALDRWVEGVAPTDAAPGIRGLAQSPTRSTPDGRFLVFESHAELGSPDSDGYYQIYRYDSLDGTLRCVSCDPSGAPVSADARFQHIEAVPIQRTTIIPNVTEDGQRVFFETKQALLPGDANLASDVYEWTASGVGGCDESDGCLALISSGSGAGDSLLYSMTPDGHDVFLRTTERLVGADVPGSSSIYDARVDGGFAPQVPPEPCEADACQGPVGAPPGLPAPASVDATEPGRPASSRPRPRCSKGKRRVMRRGKARCVRKSGGGQRRHGKVGR